MLPGLKMYLMSILHEFFIVKKIKFITKLKEDKMEEINKISKIKEAMDREQDIKEKIRKNLSIDIENDKVLYSNREMNAESLEDLFGRFFSVSVTNDYSSVGIFDPITKIVSFYAEDLTLDYGKEAFKHMLKISNINDIDVNEIDINGIDLPVDEDFKKGELKSFDELEKDFPNWLEIKCLPEVMEDEIGKAIAKFQEKMYNELNKNIDTNLSEN
jgi:hypothetical protein